MKKVYLDSNLYISLLSNDTHATRIASLLEKSENGKLQLFSSVLIYGEVIKVGSDDNYSNILEFLNVLPVKYSLLDKSIMVSAATLRLTSPSLKLPDAIHIATAIADNCDVLLSEDKQLVKVARTYLPSDSVVKIKL